MLSAPVRLEPGATFRPDRPIRILGLAAVLLLGLLPTPARAQNTLGGHFGFVLPLATRADGETTTITDDFLIGFPMGVTIRRNADIAFDLELVPVIQNSPLHVDLTVHPGVIFRIAERIGLDLFGELVLPIRFQGDSNSIASGFTSGSDSEGCRRVARTTKMVLTTKDLSP